MNAAGWQSSVWASALFPAEDNPHCFLQPLFSNAAAYLGCLTWLTEEHTFSGPACLLFPFTSGIRAVFGTLAWPLEM